MWVKRKHYKMMREELDLTNAHMIGLIECRDKMAEINARLRYENEQLKQEIFEWRQKHADEWQKRLNLIEKIEVTKNESIQKRGQIHY